MDCADWFGPSPIGLLILFGTERLVGLESDKWSRHWSESIAAFKACLVSIVKCGLDIGVDPMWTRVVADC